MGGGFHDKDVQFWHTIRIFLEKEADDFDILEVSLKAFSLAKYSRQFAPRTTRMMECVPLLIAGVGDV